MKNGRSYVRARYSSHSPLADKGHANGDSAMLCAIHPQAEVLKLECEVVQTHIVLSHLCVERMV
jgi:hypothetical protein